MLNSIMLQYSGESFSRDKIKKFIHPVVAVKENFTKYSYLGQIYASYLDRLSITLQSVEIFQALIFNSFEKLLILIKEYLKGSEKTKNIRYLKILTKFVDIQVQHTIKEKRN